MNYTLRPLPFLYIKIIEDLKLWMKTGKSTLCFVVCDNTTFGFPGRITAPRANRLVRNYSLLVLFMYKTKLFLHTLFSIP